MSETVFFKRIAIEGFRGFRDRQDIDLNASVVIITGANGTGKTSLFDAIQWLLLGTIERLEPFRYHKNEEHIVNYYSTIGSAMVETTLSFNGKDVLMRRIGSHKGSVLELEVDGLRISGREAEKRLESMILRFDEMPLRQLLITSGILQQDVMRYVLEAKPRERYQQFNQLLGLDVLDKFEAAVRDYVRTTSEEANKARAEDELLRDERAQVEIRVRHLEARQERLPSIEDARRRLSAAASRHSDRVVLAVSLPETMSETDRLFGSLRRTRRSLSEFLFAFSELSAQLLSAKPANGSDLERAEAAVSAAIAELARAESDLGRKADAVKLSERRSGEIAQLAVLAVSMLTEVCPVCGQAVDAVLVRHRLEQQASDVGKLLAERGALELAQVSVSQARRKFDDAQGGLEDIRRRFNEWRVLEQRQSQLRSESHAISLGNDVVHLVGFDPLRDSDGNGRDYTELYISALRDLEDEAAQLVLVFDTKETEEIHELRAKIAELLGGEPRRQRRVEELSRRESDARRLLDATVRSRVSVSDDRLRTLQPLVSDIFSRLDPHPSFKSLVLEHEVYRAQGTAVPVARDPMEQRPANPAVVFSTSQANIAALAIFLALGFAAGDAALPFVLLDDPLQSLDDVNVLGLADLCRFVREEKQLILSTHDRRFASLLERKLAPRNVGWSTRVVRFSGWDRSGPSLESFVVDSEAEIPRMLSA